MTNPLISVVSCIYNPLPVCSKTVLSLLEKTTYPKDQWEYILVHNHSPFPGIPEFLSSIQAKFSNVRIIDEGRNLGCNQGYSTGFASSQAKYVVKLDDDNEIIEPDWAQKFLKGFKKIPNLAYLSSDMTARQTTPYQEIDYGEGVVFQKSLSMVGFGGLVFFDREFLQKINYFMGKSSHVIYDEKGNVKQVVEHLPNSLYSGEETLVASKAYEFQKVFGYYPPVKTHHQGCEDRLDLFYPWKYWYGYAGRYKGDLEQFQNDQQAILECFATIIREPNDWYRVIIFKLLPEHPEWTWRFEFYKLALQIYYSTSNDLVKKYAGEFIELCKSHEANLPK